MKYLSKKIAFAYLTQNDDILYKKKEFYKLSNLAEQVVADNFNLYPKLEGLNELEKNRIYELIEFKFPIYLLTKDIHNENFWKNLYTKYFNSKLLEKVSYSWKSTFLEKYLENYLKNYDINVNQYKEFKKIIDSFENFIFNLNLKEISLELDFNYLFTKLVNLEHLSIIFGNKNEEKSFKNINGINLEIANKWSESFPNLKKLKSLKLYGNSIDDEILKIIIDSILNLKLELIDFSHNKISDIGARILAKFLSNNKTIKILNLSHNEISYEGILSLSEILKNDKIIEEINLKLNFINDNSIIKFFEYIKENLTIKKLDFSSNLITDDSVDKLCEFLKINNTLKELYIDCNQFTDISFIKLYNSWESNIGLIKFSIEKNVLSENNKNKLQNMILQRFLKIDNIPFITKENFNVNNEEEIKDDINDGNENNENEDENNEEEEEENENENNDLN